MLLQRQTLAEHLTRLLDMPGLVRYPRKAPSFAEYLAERYGTKDDKEVGPDGTESAA